MPHDGWHPHEHDEQGRHPLRRMVLAAATFLPFGGASAQTVDAAQRIAEAANRFLGLLDAAQRLRVLIAFDSDNRLDWHYIPRSRAGLTLGEMRPDQAACEQLGVRIFAQQPGGLSHRLRTMKSEGIHRKSSIPFCATLPATEIPT